jgi:hypothetical protein
MLSISRLLLSLDEEKNAIPQSCNGILMEAKILEAIKKKTISSTEAPEPWAQANPVRRRAATRGAPRHK